MTTSSGILFGIAAALVQSFSYVFSRMFMVKFPGSAVVLLAVSHVIMGLFSLLVLRIFWPPEPPAVSSYWLPVAGTVFFYLSAQICFFFALRHSDASRVSPLLGLKILFIALISSAALGERFSSLQMLAIGFSLGAAGLLSWSEGVILWDSLIWVVGTCFGYSLSDVCVREVIRSFEYLGLFRGAVVSAGLCYSVCGMIGAGLLFTVPRPSKAVWSNALPFSVTWFTAMLFLFASFASIGIVYGNIIQSTRGVISVLLGVLISAAGHVHLEEKMTTMMLIKKSGAALLMIGAIVLYYMG